MTTTTTPARILIVDDEPGMQLALREVLSRQGHQIQTASDGLAGLNILESEPFDLLITDIRMPEMNGMELLERARRRQPYLSALVMTAFGTIEDAVDAMKKGAADYLLKPFSTDTIEKTVARILKNSRAAAEDEAPAPEEQDTRAAAGTDPICASPAMRQVLDISRQVADSVATVLLQGESGSGKEVVARYLHQHSGRGNGPFIAVNCAALPEGLLESELFGHEKGAFTGAVLARKGKFELANHGTLLLDEISEMPLALQAKLLRVLQEREIDPIGAQRPVSLDVRVIATTNRNLEQFVQEGNFREDLFYRLQVIHIPVPPLRERREDILPLSEYFVRRHCRANRRPMKKISHEMREYLIAQPWRGNVRELENFLERAVLLCQSDVIHPGNIHLGAFAGRWNPAPAPANPAAPHASPVPAQPAAPVFATTTAPNSAQLFATQQAASALPRFTPGMTLEEMERRLILETLEQVNGNRTRAADQLGISVRTIRNKLAQYGLAASIPEPQGVGV